MNGQNVICPLCSEPVDRLLYRYHIDSERTVVERIKEQNPGWAENDGACSRCVDYYHTEIVMQQRMLPEIGPFFPVRSADDFIILPTGLRLDADQRYTGKGVTICFIDSGFYPHPDLVAHKNRIRKMIDMTKTDTASGPAAAKKGTDDTGASAWHGTMTSVVCAGDGYLSKGLYKGIAPDAELVLLKVQDEAGRITTAHIVRALEWVLDHHRNYGIRIVNMSLGDDEAISYKHSEVDRLVQELFDRDILVVAAVGNDENGLVKPPANSPAVIAVGGLDDHNRLGEQAENLYHSAYGKTGDDLMKPELIAHAIWIAAPVLPGTDTAREAAELYRLLDLPDHLICAEWNSAASLHQAGDGPGRSDNPFFVKEEIRKKIQAGKYISPHYMHVDGTSFAAPIVSAVAAQLLEANPDLTAPAIREILFTTAKRLSAWPAERQGYGLVRPRKSVLQVLNRHQIMTPPVTPQINTSEKTISFYIQHACAAQVSLAGSFNHWAKDVLLLEPGMNGVWKIEIPMLPAGRYQYKFYVDEKKWIEDVNNPWREPDGFSGFNSILVIEN